MLIENIDGLTQISFDSITTLAVASLLLLLGYAVKKKVSALEKFCIPAPVVGGFIFMFLNLIFYMSGTVAVSFDTLFQSPFMLAFFTTVGLGASFSLLKRGGVMLIVYWLICGVISVIQSAIGIGVASVTGLEPAYGLIASAISMVGGHGAAASYGATFDAMGYTSASLVGAAAATFGLISGVILGGPLAKRLIEKHNLKPEEDGKFNVDLSDINSETSKTLSFDTIIKNVTAIIVCMAVGTMVSGVVSGWIGMSLPTYVGAMFVAVILRNLNEGVSMFEFDYGLVSKIGDVMLSLFLSMALMSLKLWELEDLAGPLLILLICQVIFLSLTAYFIVFRILGKNYDAAVMCAGLMGHGLGATPSAIVNMSAVTEKYGMSTRAFMIVPIVGAFLVDIIYQPATIWFVKTFVQ